MLHTQKKILRQIKLIKEMKALVTIKGLSEFLNIKTSTLYSWVNKGSMPVYKLNGLLRFDMEEIEEWIKESRFLPNVPQKAIKRGTKNQGIDRIVKKAIDEVKGRGYNSASGKPGRGQGLGKEGEENGPL